MSRGTTTMLPSTDEARAPVAPRGLRVLVVDDSPADAALVQAALTRDRATEFVVQRVTTIADACDALAEPEVDCILLDLGLPDTMGLDGLSRIAVAAPDVPVIVVTGWDDTDMAFAAVAAGAQDYLVKDRMDVELLGRAVRYAVSRKEAERDIVARERQVRRAMAALEQSEARYRALVSVLEEGVILEDRNGLLMANESAKRIMGSPFPTLLDCRWAMVHDDESPWATDELPWEVALRTGEGVVGATIGLHRPDGGTTWLSLSSQPLGEQDDDALPAVVTSFTDITEQRASQRRLRELALHDPLTGLPNRTSLMSRIDRSLARIQRDGGSLAVLYLDLDGFKPVNDTFGHDAGDELLCAVGRRLVRALRPTDTVARIGGDEFVAVCDDVADHAEAAIVAERMAQIFAEPFSLADGVVQVGGSVGAAVSGVDGTDAASLLRVADAAMFSVKRGDR